MLPAGKRKLARFFSFLDMEKHFKKGDTVHWKSSGGPSTGKIIKVHTKDFTFKGVTHRASASEPQYEVESDKSGETAAHKASALHK